GKAIGCLRPRPVPQDDRDLWSVRPSPEQQEKCVDLSLSGKTDRKNNNPIPPEFCVPTQDSEPKPKDPGAVALLL
ncbi:unnamed protein product, partial [Amoebophrya sp. A25]